ncbi:hypothetical protein [Microseira sp. BLCC-F43]|uniref:hypothetical protein n=1 Tax=Microseira sp. BLCC-F43 TaxID=3153602 RepID=UPI0035BB06C0
MNTNHQQCVTIRCDSPKGRSRQRAGGISASRNRAFLVPPAYRFLNSPRPALG